MATLRPHPSRKHKKASVFILDNYPIVCRGLRQLIEAEPGLTVCGEALDGRAALKALKALSAKGQAPGLVLMDIALKNEVGLDVVREIKAKYPGTLVLVISIYHENFYAERALNAGAKGYVMKSQAAGTILAAVRRVLSGGVHLSEAVSLKVLHRISTPGGAGERSPIDRLSDRELEVFRLIGTGLGTRQIAASVSRSIKTIEVYRERIKKKLSLKNASELSQAAIQWS